MLFQLLKSLLMILPQSTCYRVLRDRLVSVSRFRQSTISSISAVRNHDKRLKKISDDTKTYVGRVHDVRNIHCTAKWENVRQESLEMPKRLAHTGEGDAARSEWLGYASREEAIQAEKAYREGKRGAVSVEEVSDGYHDIRAVVEGVPRLKPLLPNNVEIEEDQEEWKQFWSGGDDRQ